MNNFIKTIWSNPWYLMIIFLSTLILISLFRFDPAQILIHTFAAVIFAVLTDLIIRRIRYKRWEYPVAATISGLIIAIALPFTAPIYVPIITAVIAMVLKNVIRVSGKNLFNPANLGILIAAFLFNQGIAWWGVAVPWLMVIFLITIYKVKRYPVLLSFLILYSLLELIFRLNFNFLLLYSELLGLLFWMLIMLVEPVTSPATAKRQMIFGAIAGIVVFSMNFYSPLYAPLVGLAVADLSVPLLNRYVN